MLVASAWAVVDTKQAAVAAAREGARAYVEADTAAEGVAAGDSAARAALAGLGRGDDATVTFRQPPVFARCAPVTVRVTEVVPAVRLPWIDGLGEITVASTHTERIDPFRDGIPGPAVCPP